MAPARAEDPPAPASAPAFVFEDGAALMAQVPDFTFNFDHPAFYWLIRRIRRHDDPAVFATDENEPRTPWKFLLERPSDYRGRLVVVEGIVRSSLGTRIRGPGREDIGLVHQTELADRGTRGLCTVVTAADTRPAPMNARVRAKGYFLKVRQFGTTAGNVGFAPLVVAHHLEVVAPPVALRRAVAPRGGLTSPENMLLLLTAALAIVWLVLRRATRRRTPRAVSVARRHDVPPPGDAAPTDADFDWLADEPDPAPPDRPDDQMTR